VNGVSTDGVQALFTAAAALSPTVANNEYSQYMCDLPAGVIQSKVDIVHPATAAHISKAAAAQARHVCVRETAHMYDTVTKPFINALSASRVSWVVGGATALVTFICVLCFVAP
jgi:hypothetical protein